MEDLTDIRRGLLFLSRSGSMSNDTSLSNTRDPTISKTFHRILPSKLLYSQNGFLYNHTTAESFNEVTLIGPYYLFMLGAVTICFLQHLEFILS